MLDVQLFRYYVGGTFCCSHSEDAGGSGGEYPQRSYSNQKGTLKNAEPLGILRRKGRKLKDVSLFSQLCYETVRDYIDISLWLFPLYVDNTQVALLIGTMGIALIFSSKFFSLFCSTYIGV
jgi:hypothetical protein